MRRQSVLLRQYGIWVKLGLACLIFISLGGLNVITSFREMNAESKLPNHNKTLEDYTRPPVFVGGVSKDWQERREAVQKEVAKIIARAKAKGNIYSYADYFADYNELMDLEDHYHFYLTSPALVGGYPLAELVMLRDAEGASREVNQHLSPEQVAFMDTVRTRSEQRAGEYYSKQAPVGGYVLLTGILTTLVKWLWSKYLLMMLFWCLIYIIRFEEKDEAIRRFERHHHELGRFIPVEEPFPGHLSLKDELLICPWRFVSRILLWPFYCLVYPWHENTAEGLRYVQAKARFLRSKPFGYQLTPAEDVWLRREARKPVAEFEKTLKQLSEFEVPRLVKKSLLTAYLSLFFGILLQPAIVLAAAHSDKAAQRFYGSQVQLVQVQPDQQQLVGSDPPGTDQVQPDSQAVLPNPIDLQPVFNLLLKIAVEFWKRLPIVVFDIDHIPLNSLV